MTFEEAIRAGAARLKAAGVADAQRDARLLMRWAAAIDGPSLAAAARDALDPTSAARFERAVEARAERRPLSHITGARAFFGRVFSVTPDVLDPRPESEILVAAALARLPATAPARVLDLGVGSGALLLSVLAERPAARGLGIDVSAAALAVAEANAAALGVADRAALRLGDWLDGVDERFDAILCNPPYIGADELHALAPEVRLYEPRAALTPGQDPLTIYRQMASALERRMTPEGFAAFEVGRGQADAVTAFFEAAGLRATTIDDLNGVGRVIVARRS